MAPGLALLFSERLGALACFLENALEDLQFFGVCAGKYPGDFRGMLAEDGNNQVFTGFGKRHDAHPAVIGTFRAAHQAFFEQAIDRHADGTGREVDFRPNGVHGQRSFVQKRFQDAEVRVRDARFGDSSTEVVGGRLVGFPPNEPAMHGVQRRFCHSCVMRKPADSLPPNISISIYSASM